MRSKIRQILPCKPAPNSRIKFLLSVLLTVFSIAIQPASAAQPVETLRLTSSQAAAPFTPLPITTVKPSTALGQYIYYLADNEGKLNAQTAFALTDQFIPYKDRPITFQTKTHWYAIRLQNNFTTAQEWFVTTGVSTAPLLKAYWLDASDTTNPQAESKLIASQIAYGFPTLLFQLPLKPQEDGILLIEYQSLAHFPLTLHIYDASHLFDSTQRLKLANGIYIGAIGILFLFFFGQYLISRDKVYLYYSLFVLFAVLMMMQISGPAHPFNQGSPHQATLTTLIGGGIYTFYFIFAAEFLQLKTRNTFLYRALTLLSGAVLTLTVIGIFYPSAYALSVVIAFGLPWPIAGGIWAWRQKISSAAFFLAGSLTHCISTYFLLLACLGFAIFQNEFIFRIACLGLMFDITCFAVAIIYHSNQVRLNYNRQLQERINDLNALAESEQISAKALSMSKQAVLNLAATAHDLQQPLSAMQLLLSLQNSADPITQNVQGALNYARSLLDSALGSARHDYQMISEYIDAHSLLLAAQQRHQNNFAEKNVSLSLHCKSTPISCLPIVINRILDNLLSNAFKYTHQGRVLISGRARNTGAFLIQVWDMGRGMDHKQVGRLTTPFERINDTEELGFGLGLFIVKSLCHQAGYEFYIRSKENRGSCFSIVIPLIKPQLDWVE